MREEEVEEIVDDLPTIQTVDDPEVEIIVPLASETQMSQEIESSAVVSSSVLKPSTSLASLEPPGSVIPRLRLLFSSLS